MGGRIKAENLGDILTELPLADWPLGRVVVIEGPSTGPGDPQWWNVVDQNLAGAVEVLEAHGVVPYVAAS
jgi:hypothetical protein